MTEDQLKALESLPALAAALKEKQEAADAAIALCDQAKSELAKAIRISCIDSHVANAKHKINKKTGDGGYRTVMDRIKSMAIGEKITISSTDTKSSRFAIYNASRCGVLKRAGKGEFIKVANTSNNSAD